VQRRRARGSVLLGTSIMSEFVGEIAEVESLLLSATFPAVRALLQTHLSKLQKLVYMLTHLPHVHPHTLTYLYIYIYIYILTQGGDSARSEGSSEGSGSSDGC
jgi:hypothetical protein